MSMRSDWRYGPFGPPTSGPSSQSSPSQCMTSMSSSYDSSLSRVASVSSIRKTNVPLWWRANAQLNSAVRAIPTCGLPVGEGQKRATTGRSVTRNHLVGQCADAFDRDAHVVADLHRSDTVGGAGENDVTGQQRHERRDVFDDLGDLEDHPRGARTLLEFVAEFRADCHVTRIEVRLDPRSERAKRVEALRTRPLSVAGLQVAGRHIVADRVAKDDLRGVCRGDVAADPADHDGEFALEVHVVALPRIKDRLARPDDARVRFQEDQRLLRHVAAHFLGVCQVVLADANDLASGNDGGEQSRIFERDLFAAQLNARIQRVAVHDGDHFLAVVLADQSITGVFVGRESRDAHGSKTTGSGPRNVARMHRPAAYRESPEAV